MSDEGNQGHEGDTPGGEEGGGEQPWYTGLHPDLASNPTLQKYKTAEEAHKGHLELQKTLGSDRVSWPRDSSDEAGWAEVHKRMGVPEKADGYNLDFIKAPEGSGVENFDRFAFQEQMHGIKATPEQAKQLWENYTNMISGSIKTSQDEFQRDVDNAKAEMQQKWGEAYETKIQRGQDVINNFAKDEDQANRITAGLAKDPFGMEFLAKIGDMMAESNIGGFQEKQSFTLSPNEARMELDKVKANPDYNSDDIRVRQPLINRADDLMRMLNPGTHQRQSVI